MCGIAGTVRAEPADLQPLGEGWLRKLAHRGPDGRGWLVDGPAGQRVGTEEVASDPARVLLLHTRLAIIDLSAAARQPMVAPGGDLSIVYNGEVYNYVELREELRGRGHEFSSTSDTEVLLRGWTEWGPDLFARLEGMFALAIYDRREGALHLARDPFGIKPLYYLHTDATFAFASEIALLHELVPASRRIDPVRAYEYLRFGKTDHGSHTLLTGVRQLPLATRIQVSTREVAVTDPIAYRAWPPAIPSAPAAGDAVERVRSAFLESVALHLRSDVPVGAALSGGIDSSAVVCAARHLRPEVELHTFSYIADDDRLSEGKWVDLVVGHTGSVSHRIEASHVSLERDLDQLLAAQGEPFGGTSIYAQFCVFRAAAQAGIKVVLDGQGADELLAGYGPYAGARLATLLRRRRWWRALRFYLRARRVPGREALLRNAGPYFLPASSQGLLRRLVGREFVPAWLNRDWLRAHAVPFEPPQAGGHRSALHAALRRSLVASLPYLLRYEDRNSMFHSVESRVPFLLPSLASVLLDLPEDELIADDGTSKAIFRRAMRGIVPAAILDRKDKIGFETPELRWLQQSRAWVEATLSGEVARTLPILRYDVMMREWNRLMQNRQHHDGRAWRWLNFIRWVETTQATLET
jgi:asparagine synthase (glutamine-hydrolysing)